jgi:hypothetical protein
MSETAIIRNLNTTTHPARGLFLESMLGTFREVGERCLAIQAAYKYGVVYAVKFVAEDLKHLAYSGSMGIQCFFDLAS